MKNFICGICGKEYFDLDAYMKCVSKCGENVKAQLKAEAEQARLEKLNADLSKLKAAKEYYEGLLDKFKKEYPAEYQLNFGDKHKCPNDTCKCSHSKDTKSETIEISYEDLGKGKPKISAKVNGKEVKGGILDEVVKELETDSEYKYLTKLLSML